MCEGPARDCDDGIDCTIDLCDPVRNACANHPAGGACLIAGVCFSEGEINPDNACQACLADLDQDRFSDLDGTDCDDSAANTFPGAAPNDDPIAMRSLST